MIRISKEIAVVMREQYPRIHVRTVNRQSSHKKYYVEESSVALRAIGKIAKERGL